MSLDYRVTPDGTRPLERDPGDEVRYHIAEAIASTCHAIAASRRREEFSSLLDLLRAAKVAQIECDLKT